MEQADSAMKQFHREHLTFEFGGQAYAVDIAAVREIRGWTEPSPMPGADPNVLGVINLRGEALPLFDLAAKLGLPSPKVTERSVIIVVDVIGESVGLLVDSVSNIITPSIEDTKEPPETVKSQSPRSVAALTLIEDRLVRILDLESVFRTAGASTVDAA